MTDRFNSYKNRGKQEEFVKRARAQAVQLRKAKKDEQLTKRRNLVQDDLEDEDGYLADEPKAADSVPPNLHDILQDLISSVPEKVLEATRASRKILSKESNPPIDLFIQAAAVPRFVALLSEKSIALQFEAAWVLTNIASGSESQTKTAVEAGVCEAFLDLARQGVPNVVEQVLWGLANIAGTGAKYRDFLLQKGILPVLVELVCNSSSRTLLATAAWCLSNLCRKMGSVPDFATLLPALPALSRLLRYDSPAIVSDACWALSYFTDGPNERIQAACEAGIVPYMIALIGSCNDKMILIPALRVIGNIVTGDDLQTQEVLDAGALAVLSYHLREGMATTKKEVIWALSNILAGNVKQVETVIEAGLLQPLIEVLSSGDYKCRVEATWAICNFTCGATPKQIGLLLEYDALGPLSVMLEGADSRLIKVVLDAFGNIFRAAQDLDVLHQVMQVLEEAGFVDRVELLQMHELEEIYKRASRLTSLFSPGDFSDENDDMSLDVHQSALNFAQM